MGTPTANPTKRPQPLENKQAISGQLRDGAPYRNHWLQKCRTLPESVWRECVRRFEGAETADSVARWLLTVPGRGGMGDITHEWTMRRYMGAFCKVVREEKKKRQAAAAIVKQRAEAIAKKKAEEAAARVIRVISIGGGAPPAEAPASEQRRNEHHEPQTLTQAILETNKRVFTTREMVNYTLALVHEQFQRCAYVQNRLKRPNPETTKLLHVLCKLTHLSNLIDLNEFAKEKARRERGQHSEDFDAESLANDHDVEQRPVAPVSSAHIAATVDASQVPTAGNKKSLLRDILAKAANKTKSA